MRSWTSFWPMSECGSRKKMSEAAFLVAFFQEQCPERRQREAQRIGAPMHTFLQRLSAAHIADAASAVLGRVAVQNFFPVTSGRNADFVAQTRNRCEITNNHHITGVGLAFAQQRNDTGGCVVTIDPLKALWFVIEPMQRLFRTI